MIYGVKTGGGQGANTGCYGGGRFSREGCRGYTLVSISGITCGVIFLMKGFTIRN